MPTLLKPYRPSEIRLTELGGEISPEVQILRVGNFKHPQYGDFEITPKILAEMKANFDKKTRGIDIAFDYFHDSNKIAAGWPKALELRENGTELWAQNVEWTPRAKQMLADKELRYFSPDFAFQWQDPETQNTFSNVLFGGGLTNRPFVKGMEPIVSLGEHALMAETDEEIELGGPGSGPQGGGNSAARQAKRQASLSKMNQSQNAFNKQSGAVKKGIADKNTRVAQSKYGTGTKMFNEEGDIQMDEKDQMIADLQKQVADLKAAAAKDGAKEGDANEAAQMADKMKNLEESNKKLLGEKAALEQDKEKLLAEKTKAEREGKFNVMLTEGKACVAQKDAFLANDMDKFLSLAEPLNLGGKGSAGSNPSDNTEDKILKLAEEKTKANPKLSFGEAVSLAKKELK